MMKSYHPITKGLIARVGKSLAVLNFQYMKRVAIVGTLVLLAGGVAMFFAVQGVHMPVLDTAGPIADAQRKLIWVTIALTSLIAIPVFFLLFFFAWKYRAESPEQPGHHHPTWDHDSAEAEFLWWLVPSAIIAVLGIIAWQSSHALDPYRPIESDTPQLTVQVVALNWKWLFIYPGEGIATVNELVIPERTPIQFLLTGDAPMNSFWVPSLGGMIMVMPGMQTQLHLAADQTGVFEGSSGNLSGKGFSGMRFKARSVTNSEFLAWVAQVRLSDTALDHDRYEVLRMDSENEPVSYFYPVDQGLYTAVYQRYMSHPEKRDHQHEL